ncbi:MAG: hypothetical protein HN757_16515 [Calditrichaeota bacterium]|jgi:sugar O-acyltransferase (sialic acid O-acetyltransferase NeuD family)|nr:hypothetical protein [Calditrichota bacterium]
MLYKKKEISLILDVIILGATSYPELSELISDINAVEKKIRVIGLLDDDISLHDTSILGVKVLGELKESTSFPENVGFILGVGSMKNRMVRHSILSKLGIAPERFPNLIHPTVKIFSSSSIGYGIIIHYGSIIFNDVVMNNHALIMAQTLIGARNVVGEGAVIASQVSTTSDVKLGSYSYVGTNSTISEMVEVGPGAAVSIGSVVYRDVRAGAQIFGNPARIVDGIEVSEEILDIWKNQKVR